MYLKPQFWPTSLESEEREEGETIEMKMERVLNNGEAIKDGAPIIYTKRSDGVLPQYDIRTDRFEIAVDAMDKVNASRLAQRESTPVIDLKPNSTGEESK